MEKIKAALHKIPHWAWYALAAIVVVGIVVVTKKKAGTTAPAGSSQTGQLVNTAPGSTIDSGTGGYSLPGGGAGGSSTSTSDCPSGNCPDSSSTQPPDTGSAAPPSSNPGNGASSLSAQQVIAALTNYRAEYNAATTAAAKDAIHSQAEVLREMAAQDGIGTLQSLTTAQGKTYNAINISGTNY